MLPSRLAGALLALVLALALPPDAAAPGDPPAGVVPDVVVIGYPGGIPADVAAQVDRLGGDVLLRSDVVHFVSVRARDGDGAALVARAQRLPGIAWAERDGYAHALDFAPNDPLYGAQWGLSVVHAPAAWSVQQGSHAVKLAILDTGIDGAHPDLAGNYCVQGPDYTGGNWANLHYHGTHVMGIAAAVLDNGVGVAGVSQSCVMDVRVLDANGFGQWSWVAAGVGWAAQNGARVISMSIGGTGGSTALENAVNLAFLKSNVLVVSAAGNAGCGLDTVTYPARYPGSMAVAALSSATTTAGFSSCGPAVEIAAPGEGVLSTLPSSSYGSLSGTSMATPHVSGIAALLFAQNPGLSALDARCVLDATAKDFQGKTTPWATDPQIGFGVVDAAAALALPTCGAQANATLAWAAVNHHDAVPGCPSLGCG